jgi:lysozyme family protein
MSNFDACWAFTIQEEGGFSNDPQDPGGATNHGITLRELALWRGAEVSVQDVIDLQADEAGRIAKALYWRAMSCDALPIGVDLVVFDFGFNAGQKRSVEFLQQQVEVPVDGDIGPITELAARGADRQATIIGLTLRDQALYRSLPTFNRFGNGWIARTQARQQLALKMAAGAAAA